MDITTRNKWTDRLKTMLVWAKEDRHRNFIISVQNQMEANPTIPSFKQAQILENIYLHLQKLNMSEAEKDAYEAASGLGL